MTATMTRDQAERLVSANDRLIAGDDDEDAMLELYERIMTEVGGFLGSGEPGPQFSEDSIDDLGADYICALDDGAVVTWGPDAGRFYTTGHGYFSLRGMRIRDAE